MFSKLVLVLLGCFALVSTVPMIVYDNAQFNSTDLRFLLANLFPIPTQNSCICQCYANSSCITGTFSGITHTCILFSAYIWQGYLQLVTNNSTSVFSFPNRTASAVSPTIVPTTNTITTPTRAITRTMVTTGAMATTKTMATTEAMTTTKTMATTRAMTTSHTTNVLPMQCRTYMNNSDSTRLYTYNTVQSNCDASLTAGWYRFVGAAGSVLSTAFQDSPACGARNPGFIASGVYRNLTVGQTTTLRYCFNEYLVNSCNFVQLINVTMCINYYVWYIVPGSSSNCNFRYCTA